MPLETMYIYDYAKVTRLTEGELFYEVFLKIYLSIYVQST